MPRTILANIFCLCHILLLLPLIIRKIWETRKMFAIFHSTLCDNNLVFLNRKIAQIFFYPHMRLVGNYFGKTLRSNVIWEASRQVPEQVPEMVSPVFWFDALNVSTSEPKSAPAGFNVRLIERFGVELEWQSVDGATGYKVRQRTLTRFTCFTCF